MRTFRIRVNGLPYQGTDLGRSEMAMPRPAGWTGRAPSTRDVVLVGSASDPATPIMGSRNLRSHVERILTRIEDGSISISEILITTDPEGAKPSSINP